MARVTLTALRTRATRASLVSATRAIKVTPSLLLLLHPSPTTLALTQRRSAAWRAAAPLAFACARASKGQIELRSPAAFLRARARAQRCAPSRPPRGREKERWSVKELPAVVISAAPPALLPLRHHAPKHLRVSRRIPVFRATAITTPQSPLCAFLRAPSPPFPRIIAPFSARFILFSFRLHAERSATRPTILFISKDSLIVSGMRAPTRAALLAGKNCGIIR